MKKSTDPKLGWSTRGAGMGGLFAVFFFGSSVVTESPKSLPPPRAEGGLFVVFFFLRGQWSFCGLFAVSKMKSQKWHQTLMQQRFRGSA